MGVTYESVGSGRARYGEGEVESYTVSREATPTTPGDSNGGVGTFTLTAREDSEYRSMFMGQNRITLTDTRRGVSYGTLLAPSSSDGALTLTGESLLMRLRIDRAMAPTYGRLEDVFKLYLVRCGIPRQNIRVDEELADLQVVYPSWEGDVWDHMKMLCTALPAEIVEDGQMIILQPLRKSSISINDRTGLNWDVSFDQLARNIQITSWNTEYTPNDILYPRNDDDSTIIAVKANVVTTVWKKLSGAAPIILNQPKCVKAISVLPYVAGNGEYVILGKDDLPVEPQWWNDNGGQVRVRIVPYVEAKDLNVIEIKVYGPSSDLYGPYKIAESSGAGVEYDAFYITGAAVLFEEEVITIPTGATAVDTSAEFASAATGPFIETYGQAFERGQEMASEAGSARVTVSTELRSYADAPNIRFGSLPGAVLEFANSKYRVQSCSFTRATFSIVAQRFLDGYDLDEVWPRTTTALDFDGTWTEEYSTADFMIQPLRRGQGNIE